MTHIPSPSHTTERHLSQGELGRKELFPTYSTPFNPTLIAALFPPLLQTSTFDIILMAYPNYKTNFYPADFAAGNSSNSATAFTAEDFDGYPSLNLPLFNEEAATQPLDTLTDYCPGMLNERPTFLIDWSTNVWDTGDHGERHNHHSLD